jgi:hypothetical protein
MSKESFEQLLLQEVTDLQGSAAAEQPDQPQPRRIVRKHRSFWL